MLRSVFISPDENRLRAGWRILIHLVIAVICVLTVGLLLVPALSFLGNLSFSQSLFLNEAIFGVGITLSIFLARRFLDRRPFASLGLGWSREAVKDLWGGFGLTGLMMGGIFLTFWAAGWLNFEGFAWNLAGGAQVARDTFIMLASFTLVGWNEELLNRGYWLQNIAAGWSLPGGVILSSLIFALLHLSNPGASWVAVIGLVFAGLFLAYGYVRTRQLWLPIGLHIGWNFFEGTVFGFPVSGLNAPGLIRHTVTGPELITGGAFGPEAGLVILPALALGAGVIYLATRDRISPKPARIPPVSHNNPQ